MSRTIVTEEGLVVLADRPRTEIEQGIIWTLFLIVSCALVYGTVRWVIELTSPQSKSCDCTKSIKNFFSDNGVGDGMRAVVQQRLDDLKMSVFRTLMKVTCFSMILWDLDVLGNMLRGSYYKGTGAAGEIVALLLQSFCVSAFVRPDLLSSKRINIVYLGMMLFPTLQSTPLTCCTHQGAVTAFVGNAVLVVLLNGAKGLGSWRDVVLVSLANLVFTGCWSYTWWTIHGNIETFDTQVARIIAWLLLTASIMLLSGLWEAGCRKLLIQGLQLAEIEERHNAATALLRSIYDVVVELDSNGCMTGPSQDLGSLLLRADRKMQGVQLAGLIVDEGDRTSFERRLAAPRPKTVGLAENMHVSMKDSLGNVLRMEMMWFACSKVDGCTHYIVGIREFSDQAQSTSEGNSTIRSPDYFPGPGADLFTGVDRGAGTGGGEGSSSSEGSPSLAAQTHAEVVDAQADVDAAQAMAVIDLTAADHPIRAITTGFRANVGHVSKNAPLARVVKRPQPMVAWMESCVNSAENGEPQPRDHRVSLRMPEGKLAALCKLVLTEGSDLSTVDIENVVVLFHNIIRKTAVGSLGLRGTPANASNGSLAAASL